jgi:hypothetical protein
MENLAMIELKTKSQADSAVDYLTQQIHQMDAETGYIPHVYSLVELSQMTPDRLRQIANTAALELDITNFKMLPEPLTPDTLRQIANRMSTLDLSHE